MNNTIKLLLSILPFTTVSCGQSPVLDHNINNNQYSLPEYKVQIYQYDSLTISTFFKALIENHLKDYLTLDLSEYGEFCKYNKSATTDSTNIERYYTVKILHDFFTSQTADDCSKGEILNIPYEWHWVEPNPRHEIYFSHNNKLLKDTKPPPEFSKYSSYADIDRTPYLFLSDMVQEEPKYYSSSCDTFSTFGWCSEREMAFVSLAKLLNYNGKVVAEGNHSWSELIISMNSVSGEVLNFLVTVDNTFNNITWTKIEGNKIPKWKAYLGDSKLEKWYNERALSDVELQKISSHSVSSKAMARIENKLVAYLERKLNGH